jgi:hypothetical protein
LFNNRDREQFYAPSRQLFDDFCQTLVDRYELDDIIIKGQVEKLDTVENGFEIFLTDALDPIRAKRVVCALGNSNRQNLPDWYGPIHAQDSSIQCAVDFIDRPITIPSSVQSAIKTSRLLIVGGGLTSAQLVQQGLNLGFRSITLVCRSKLKVKQFDLDLEWVGRSAFIQFAKFWNEDPKSRLGMLKNAKGGGSVTPEYFCKIKDWQQNGVLQLQENCTIVRVEKKECWCVSYKHGEQAEFDCIWIATGGKNDIATDPLFNDILRKHPIDIVGGLPALTKGMKYSSDLQWSTDLELFLMSGYASLSAGPNATNLQGGRVIAERLGSVLWEKWLHELGAITKEPEKKPVLTTLADMAGNMGNYWSALVDAD